MLGNLRPRVSTGGRLSPRTRLVGLALVVLVALLLALPSMNLRRGENGLTDSPTIQRISRATQKALDGASNLVGRQPKTTAVKTTTGRAATSKARPKRLANKPSAKNPAAAPKPATKAKATASAANRRKARRILSERTVAEGDYLRRIAARYYGDEMLWPLVWQYNKQRAKQSGQDLQNPDLIYPGWNLYIPKKEQSEK